MGTQEGSYLAEYSANGESQEIATGPIPFDLSTGRIFEDHEVFDTNDEWIGADRAVPYRRITNSVLTECGPRVAKELFLCYLNGDYGEGEAGFAIYRIGDERVYIIDDAVRSPEGRVPKRDPSTSPGPQTLMMSQDY